MNERTKKWLFILLFVSVAVISQQINFSALLGAPNQFFTLFQFFGPIAGSFLGPLLGSVIVFVSQLFHFIIGGNELTALTLLRLLPMVGAAIYFGTKRKYIAVVPVIAIAAFLLHPVGRQVWYFSLFWIIPLLAMIPKDNIIVKSFGATFTAHAIGGMFWIYSVPMTPEAYVALIPIVIFERTIFALGIASSFVVASVVLDKIDQQWKLPLHIKFHLK